jgi:glycosidase
MYEWTRDWIALRREHMALRRGGTIDLVYDEDVYAFARRSHDETILIIINRAATPKKMTIALGLIETTDGAQLLPLLGAKERVKAAGGNFAFEAPPRTARAYKLIGAE